jgi:hypothetical protein
MYFLSLICLSTIPEPRPGLLKHPLETSEGVCRKVGVIRVCRAHIGHVDILCGANGMNVRRIILHDPDNQRLLISLQLHSPPTLLVHDKRDSAQPPHPGPLKSLVGELVEEGWHVDYDRKWVPSTQKQYVNDEPKRKKGERYDTFEGLTKMRD